MKTKMIILFCLISFLKTMAYASGEPDRCTVIYPSNETFISGNLMIIDNYQNGSSRGVLVTTQTASGNRKQYLEELYNGLPLVLTYTKGRVQNRLIMECH